MHNWWTDIKEQISAASKAVGDVFDRRALVGEVEGGGVAREQEAMSPSGREGRDVDVDVDAHVEGRQEGLPDKVRRWVISTKLAFSLSSVVQYV